MEMGGGICPFIVGLEILPSRLSTPGQENVVYYCEFPL